MKHLCAAIFAIAAGICHAQPFPAKPVHLVVPYAAGGGPDVQARLSRRAPPPRWSRS